MLGKFALAGRSEGRRLQEIMKIGGVHTFRTDRRLYWPPGYARTSHEALGSCESTGSPAPLSWTCAISYPKIPRIEKGRCAANQRPCLRCSWLRFCSWHSFSYRMPRPTPPTIRWWQKITLGGEGGWDYFDVDPTTGHVFIPRGEHILRSRLQRKAACRHRQSA